jgi:hypothetical protein
MPLLLVALTAAGLLAGLLGEGWFKTACWLGLGLPAAISLWALFWSGYGRN